jgi:hypothetical protein
VPDPTDQKALDELVKRDDEAKAKEQEAKQRGEDSWDELDEKSSDDQEATRESTELTVPMEVPTAHRQQVESYVEALGPLAKTAGVANETVQEIVNHAVSLAVTDQSGVDLNDTDACINVLIHQCGGLAEAREVHADAIRAYEKLPQSVKDWLIETRLGNSPAVVQAIAAYERGDFDLSPEQAQAELEKLTRDPKSPYRDASHKLHKQANARANRLYERIAKAEEKASRDEPKRESRKSATPTKTEQLDREIKLLLWNPAIKDKGHPKHASLREARQALLREVA